MTSTAHGRHSGAWWRTLGASALAVVVALALGACGLKGNAADTSDTIKIGYVSPRTGAASAFAESDAFILEQVRAAFAKGITAANGKKYKVQIIDRDTGSDPAKAGEIADELITKDHVDMILVTSTPETIHPVADKCELEGIPCISTIEPWQSWFFGRNGDPKKGFKYTYHFFDGLESIAKSESALWKDAPTNKVVGVLWPNDADGNAFRNPANGYLAAGHISGYKIVDPGAYEDGTKDFSAIINKFKKENVQILAGVPAPQDFATFWTQAAQQGFKPKIATISKAILFESAVQSLPSGIGNGLSSAAFWLPQYPYKSSLTGISAGDLAKEYSASPEAKGQSWNQALGPNYALFEVANAVFAKVDDPHAHQAVADQIGKTKVDTILGPIDWTATGPSHPVPNVATIPMVGTQWVKDGAKFKLTVVDNAEVPAVPLDGKLQPIS